VFKIIDVEPEDNCCDYQESKIRVICCDCIADMVTKERVHATDRMIKI
jgi:hypothetical protein